MGRGVEVGCDCYQPPTPQYTTISVGSVDRRVYVALSTTAQRCFYEWKMENAALENEGYGRKAAVP